MDCHDVAFSRARNPELPTTELSVNGVPKVLVDMLDAVSLAERGKRGPLVIAILTAWAKKEARRATVMHRVLGANPEFAELARLAEDDEEPHQ